MTIKNIDLCLQLRLQSHAQSTFKIVIHNLDKNLHILVNAKLRKVAIRIIQNEEA